MLKCVIVPLPGRSISGILPNNKRITEETTMCLNKREILKCMKQASVYGIRFDGSRVLLTDSESINKEIMNKVDEKKEKTLFIISMKFKHRTTKIETTIIRKMEKIKITTVTTIKNMYPMGLKAPLDSCCSLTRIILCLLLKNIFSSVHSHFPALLADLS